MGHLVLLHTPTVSCAVPSPGTGCYTAGGSTIFHAAGFVILVPKFSFLGLKLFDVLSLANTYHASGYSAYLLLDVLWFFRWSLQATEVG